jgi:hypothetical protein
MKAFIHTPSHKIIFLSEKHDHLVKKGNEVPPKWGVRAMAMLEVKNAFLAIP